MATEPQVQVVGLRAFNRDLAKMSDPQSGDLLRAMKLAGKTALEPVAEALRGALPHDSGDLAGTVRLSSTRTGAGLRYGTPKVNYAGPVDFGGYPGDREFVKDGRYLFPVAEGMAPRAADLYSSEIQRTLDAFGWTNTTSDGEAVHD